MVPPHLIFFLKGIVDIWILEVAIIVVALVGLSTNLFGRMAPNKQSFPII